MVDSDPLKKILECELSFYHLNKHIFRVGVSRDKQSLYQIPQLFGTIDRMRSLWQSCEVQLSKHSLLLMQLHGENQSENPSKAFVTVWHVIEFKHSPFGIVLDSSGVS